MVLSRLSGWLSGQRDMVEAVVCLTATSAMLPAVKLLDAGGLAAVNLATVAGQLGCQVYINFIDGPTKRANMEKTALGNLQTRLFHKFGIFCGSTSILALATYQFMHRGTNICSYLLTFSLAVNLTNSLILFPTITSTMLNMRRAEANITEANDDEKAAAEQSAAEAKRRFRVSHISSMLGIVFSIAANTAYIYTIGQRVAGNI